MNKKLRLIVSNVVGFEVKGRINDGGAKPLDVRFRVTADRISTAEYREALSADNSASTRDFLAQRLRGWSGQRLVVGDDDQPVEYDTEALDVMLSLVGMERLFLSGYLDALAVAETPEGRAKN